MHMTPGEAADLLQHALQKQQPGIWYVVDDVNGFNLSFWKSINLSRFLDENFLQLSGIISKYGDNYRFNMRNLDTIRISLQENITMNTSRCFLERGGKNLVFLCINAPLFRSPREQANSRQCLTMANNQLDVAYLAILNWFSNCLVPEAELIDDAPMLVEEAAEVEEGDDEEEGLGEAAGEEDEEGQQQLQSYQLSNWMSGLGNTKKNSCCSLNSSSNGTMKLLSFWESNSNCITYLQTS